ncbi:MAG: peptidylprolyl isomerase [Candidatus Eisenbacteria bacterium]
MVNPVVLVKTSMGDIRIELFADKAPITVQNFLAYTDEKFYDGTIFHRVMENFVIQGGGFTPDLVKKPTKDAIQNEAANGISNTRGTIAMARLPEPHTATSQFFINVQDNQNLDHFDNADRFGYCVFGTVIEGLDVVDRIRKVETGSKPPLPRDVPLQDVVILSVAREEMEAKTEQP